MTEMELREKIKEELQIEMELREKIKEELRIEIATTLLLSTCKKWWEVGSRITCNPPPTDTDRDILCHVYDLKKFIEQAKLVGFVQDGTAISISIEKNRYNDPSISKHFVSMRLGENNLIITESERFAKKFNFASSICARLNLLKKEDRIVLFDAIMYGPE